MSSLRNDGAKPDGPKSESLGRLKPAEQYKSAKLQRAAMECIAVETKTKLFRALLQICDEGLPVRASLAGLFQFILDEAQGTMTAIYRMVPLREVVGPAVDVKLPVVAAALAEANQRFDDIESCIAFGRGLIAAIEKGELTSELTDLAQVRAKALVAGAIQINNVVTEQLLPQLSERH